MKYKYMTIEVLPEELDKQLDYFGSYGWMFQSLVVMQRHIQKTVLGNQGMTAQQVEIKFLLIFYKIDQSCQA